MTVPAERRLVTVASGDARYPAPAPSRFTPLPGLLDNSVSWNGASFVQDALTTHDGTQYAVWVDDSRHPVIGKRTLPGGRWETFDLATVAGNPLASPVDYDGHNVLSVGVDPTGYIHVSGNLHGQALRYTRSTAAGSITAWTAPGMVGDETAVTYPQFVTCDGEFLFVYRGGVSGNGNTVINAYNTTTKAWSRRSIPLSGMAPVSPDESPYTNHVACGADGSMHLFFMWRVTDDVATSHDICHMQSMDHGVTWTTAAGAALTLPVTPATSPIIRTGNPELMNQTGAAVDDQGRPHAAWWIREAANSFRSELTHFWWDGTWHQDVEVVIDPGVPNASLARPSVLCHGGRTFLIYSTGVNQVTSLRCKDVSSGVRLPDFSLADRDLGDWEPTYDTRAVDERGELHMLLTPLPVDAGGVGADDPDFDACWGGVLSVDLPAVGSLAAQVEQVPGPDTLWVGAPLFASASGSPVMNNLVSAPAWQLDPAATEVISTMLNVPDGWRTFDVDVWWTNAAAGAGNVVLNARYVWRNAGSNITGGEVNLGNVTLAAPAQNIVQVTTLVSGLRRADGYLFRTNLRRVGGDAADTLANDVAVFGLMLRRAS